MNGYWMIFEDGSRGYCEGQTAYDAKHIAEHLTKKKVKGSYTEMQAWVLPYPAEPVIWQFDHPIAGKRPTYCHTPENCKGNTGCPRRVACTE